LKNIQTQSKIRAPVRSTADVLVVDATADIVAVADIDTPAAEGYARASRNDPRSVPGFVYLRLTPQRTQVWRGSSEFAGRTVMRGGVWLDDPVE
jgi:hypothetical protein